MPSGTHCVCYDEGMIDDNSPESADVADVVKYLTARKGQRVDIPFEQIDRILGVISSLRSQIHWLKEDKK
jgi:hypothetical protein